MDTAQRQGVRHGEESPRGARADGANGLLRLTANDLRRLAEAADGYRGEELELVEDDDGKLKIRRMKGGPSSSHLPIRIITAKKAPNRRVPKSVVLTHPDGHPLKPLDTEHFDAVLWGEAAADKFLVPYYVRFYSEDEMERLRTAIRNDKVLALAHIYPTIYVELEEQLRAILEKHGIRDEIWVLPDHVAPAFPMGFMPLSYWLALQQ